MVQTLQEKKEKQKERSRKHYLNNTEIMKERTLRWGNENVEKRMLNLARKRARKVGLEFSITIEDIVIPEICPYLKTKLITSNGNGQNSNNVSLDRIDSSKGYIKGNVQVISHLANSMKNNASKEQLVRFATSIIEMEK